MKKVAQRYCPVSESFEESFKQMKAIRSGKMKKITWKELKKELQEEDGEMEVSKAYLTCLDEEATQLFKKDIESANLRLDVAKKGLELFNKLAHDENDN
ncbi:hypothetical protein EXM90_11890 [Clostridium botulinum]|uniref:hypothetical protein n=1 Tax=Clostridium botulinum TaxID=1491 RepID=UPI000774C8AB|nr:hypothetical protein [Clostridium botulinum]MBN3451415.1 hypothetical protein [Clostridium botulinum]NFB64600.1 hypothetical protein [Clostridium botulinum]NFB82126.1 hypothetical protein [Clostridium botulinum]NFC02241.1 hypothetical protein [Clostridium botulinum]NFC09211.1 hypothetical protein [Clostridium botulinum]